MIGVEVKIDLRPLHGAMKMVSYDAREWAIKEALGRAANTMRVTANRTIGKQANVFQKDVTARTANMPVVGLQSGVRAKSTWFPASYKKFGATQTASGAGFTPWQQRQFTKHAFIATMKSGHQSIFIRVKSASKRRVGPNRSQLPIADIGWGPNIATEMVRQDQPAGKAIMIAGQAMFHKRAASNLDRLFKNAKSKFGL
jgi:hypothetical protein